VLGRLGADAELRTTKTGDQIASFRVAADSGYGDKKVTTWVGCAIFGKRGATLAPMLKKGTRVMVVGPLTTREWEGKTYLEVRVAELEFAGDAKAAGGEARGGPAPKADDDDIPF
jgi:single-strand DNA-binding protein